VSRPGSTADPRAQAARELKVSTAAKQLRRDITRLLALPEFRRYMAHVIHGRAELGKANSWRRDSEIHKVAAVKDFAANLLSELAAHDAQGFILLEQEHVNRMAEELEVLPLTQTQETDDAS